MGNGFGQLLAGLSHLCRSPVLVYSTVSSRETIFLLGRVIWEISHNDVSFPVRKLSAEDRKTLRDKRNELNEKRGIPRRLLSFFSFSPAAAFSYQDLCSCYTCYSRHTEPAE